MQRHQILCIFCDHDVRPELLHVALHSTHVGKNRVIELDRIQPVANPLTVFDPKSDRKTNVSGPAPALRISFGPPISAVGPTPLEVSV